MEALVYIFFIPPLFGLYLLTTGGFWMITISPILRVTGKPVPHLESPIDKIAMIVFYDPHQLNKVLYTSTGKFFLDWIAYVCGFSFGLYGLFYMATELF